MPRLFAPHGYVLVSLPFWCGVFVASVARAETEAIRIEYRAIAGCPSAEEFRDRVFERATSARLASNADSAARTFVVAIERRQDGVSGSLLVREPSGETVAREVNGAQCSEVATALALATSLAIDPRAAAPLTDEPAKKLPSPPATEPVATQEPRPALPPQTESWWSAALGPRVQTGVSPSLSLGGAAQIAWHNDALRTVVSGLGVELSWLEARSYAVSTASSSFRFLLVRPFLCSLQLRLSEGLYLSPCVGAELGALTGTGADLPAPATETRAWVAAELLLRLRLQASKAWFAELDGGPVLPFTRYTFVFREPDTQIHTVPALAAAASLRLGLRL